MLISALIQSLVNSSQLCTRLAALRKHFVVHVRMCYDYYHYNTVTKVTVLEETYIEASKVINGHSFMH